MSRPNVLILRHAEAEGNAERRFIGQTDVGLSPLGLRQAEVLTRRLRTMPITRIVSSDLQRCLDTVSGLAESLEIEIEPDQRWREIANGQWGGLVADEIARRWPDAWQRYRSGEDVDRPEDLVRLGLDAKPQVPTGERISVIIPALNESERIGTVVDRAQRGANVEISRECNESPGLICYATPLKFTAAYVYRAYGNWSQIAGYSKTSFQRLISNHPSIDVTGLNHHHRLRWLGYRHWQSGFGR